MAARSRLVVWPEESFPVPTRAVDVTDKKDSFERLVFAEIRDRHAERRKDRLQREGAQHFSTQ